MGVWSRILREGLNASMSALVKVPSKHVDRGQCTSDEPGGSEKDGVPEEGDANEEPGGSAHCGRVPEEGVVNEVAGPNEVAITPSSHVLYIPYCRASLCFTSSCCLSLAIGVGVGAKG